MNKAARKERGKMNEHGHVRTYERMNKNEEEEEEEKGLNIV